MTEPTDAELWQLYMQQPGQHKDPIDFARAALAKWGTPAPVGVEPFGIWHEGETEDESDFFLFKDSGDVACPTCIKLYTADQALAMVREPLTDEQIDAVAESMTGGLDGFLKGWGWRQFAREILKLRRMPDWEPQFDCMTPKQEELAVQFCQEIAGPRGKRGSPPDPVRLLEMAEALYKAEREHHHGIKGGQHG